VIQELSVIIPTLNEEHYLHYLLESLSREDIPQKLQVIVVDGNSTDRTIDIAK
jgi:glycosyltransferase involved in cell wall biosynthesis